MKKNTFNPSAARSIPQRTCAVCRKVKGKKEMVRIVRTPEGNIEVDATGKKEGRGAYICHDRACWDKLIKGKHLEHAFKSEISRSNLDKVIKDGKDLLKE